MSTETDDFELEWTTCNLCGATDPRELFTRTFDGTVVWRVVECRQCGLRYTNPRPTQDTIYAFYNKDYGS